MTTREQLGWRWWLWPLRSRKVQVAVATIAVIAWNASAMPAPRWELLFWEAVEPAVIVQPTETFGITELKFEIVELGDL